MNEKAILFEGDNAVSDISVVVKEKEREEQRASRERGFLGPTERDVGKKGDEDMGSQSLINE